MYDVLPLFIASNNKDCYKPGLVGRVIVGALQGLTNLAGKFPNGNGTGFMFGISGGAAGGSVTGDGTRAFVTDGRGNAGIINSIAFGAGSAIGRSAASGLFFGDSSYQSLGGYSGFGGSFTVSGGAGLGGSVSLGSSQSGMSVSYTVGDGYGLSASGAGSYTWVTPICK